MDLLIIISDIIISIMVITSILFILYYGINIIKFKPLIKDEINKDNNFCILIPARNESKVIKKLLDSIVNQTYKINLSDVYVIVEDIDDPTVLMVKEYGMSYYVRQNIGNRKKKGYALDECIKYILEGNKKYDAYLIFDADNSLKEDFIFQMNKSLNQGYDITIGYRNSTNWNKSSVSVCSGLTFTMINNFGNIERIKKNYNVVISGTGYYIKGSLIEKWNGFPFYTLTEDYELTLYSTLNDLKTSYNYEAQYYDEQPITLKMSNKQRKRWVRGYFDARKIYSKQIIESKNKKKKGISNKFKSFGVWPFVIALVICLYYFVLNIVLGILAINSLDEYLWFFIRSAGVIAYLYVTMMIFTCILLLLEKKRAKFKVITVIKALLYNPIFFGMYIGIFVGALSKKEVKWDAIEHNGRQE